MRSLRKRPVVGAIRWDAWTGGRITEQVERTLGPRKYHDRLPWFARVLDDTTVKIDGSRQDVMDREIDLAASAGLDYWAFLIYPRGNPMSVALEQYLASPMRGRIRFCQILHNTLNVPDEQWPAERRRAVEMLETPGYQTVLGNRPLVYEFQGGQFPFDRFSDFLSAARKKGLDPYCVYMGWDPASDYQKVRQSGFHAVSAYAKSSSQARYSSLAKTVEADYWVAAARAGVPYIPLVTTGWDKTPRKDNPVTWEQGHGYHRQTVFPSRAKPLEIAEHLRNGIAFVREHPETCEANAVIIYAWNEYDEGGWLAPTRNANGSPNTSRLDAIRDVLYYWHFGDLRWQRRTFSPESLGACRLILPDSLTDVRNQPLGVISSRCLLNSRMASIRPGRAASPLSKNPCLTPLFWKPAVESTGLHQKAPMR